MNIDPNSKTVIDMSFSGQSCAITRASAALLADHIIGKKIDEIVQMDRETMYELIGSKIHPGRVKCLLLPLENVKYIISQNI